MDTDLILATGLVVVVLSLPTVMSAFAANRSLIGPLLFAGLGAGLIVAAYRLSEDGYAPADVPSILLETVAWMIR